MTCWHTKCFFILNGSIQGKLLKEERLGEMKMLTQALLKIAVLLWSPAGL